LDSSDSVELTVSFDFPHCGMETTTLFITQHAVFFANGFANPFAIWKIAIVGAFVSISA
jgi:hypothetical protein